MNPLKKIKTFSLFLSSPWGQSPFNFPLLSSPARPSYIFCHTTGDPLLLQKKIIGTVENVFIRAGVILAPTFIARNSCLRKRVIFILVLSLLTLSRRTKGLYVNVLLYSLYILSLYVYPHACAQGVSEQDACDGDTMCVQHGSIFRRSGDS